MLHSAMVHASNDGHITAYEELFYNKNMEELSGQEGSCFGEIQEIPRPLGLYHKMILIIKN